MALMRCDECGGIVSTEADYCPHCGKPVKQKPQNSRLFLYILALCILAGAITGIWVFSEKQNNAKIFKSNYENNLTDGMDLKSTSGNSSYTYTPVSNEEKALDQAQSYLNSQAFSYSGLIEQLEFHGFSHEEAVYGADHCGADWMEQALKNAHSYLRSQAFSYRGLKDQLEFSGYTPEEAEYGVDNCDADWNEQAVLKARSYKNSFPDWDAGKLKKQLVFSGFSQSEAEYGVDHM